MLDKKRTRWTETEKEYLIKNSGKMKDEDMAKFLNKSLKAVREKRRTLGIKKSQGRGIVKLRKDN